MNKFAVYFSLILTGGIAYYSSLGYGFSQDDFIHLYSSQAFSLNEFLNFFNPFYHYPDIFFYRPLTTQVYFFLNHTLFNLNPLPFHIEGLVLHLVNSILFFMLIQKVWQNRKISFVSALFYSVSAAHFLSLYYISAFQETARMFFILLSLLLFFKYQDSKSKLLYICSIVAFVAALLSKETSVIMPFLLFPLEILRKKDQKAIAATQVMLKLIVPFMMIIFIYGVIRLTGFQSIFNEGAYNITFSFSGILQNLKWYLIWSPGLPEILSSYPSLKPDSLFQFSKDLPFGAVVLILSGLTVVITAILFPSKFITKRIIISSALVFFIALGPVLILHQHRYPQYLDLAFIGFLPVITLIFLQPKGIRKILGIAGIIFFLSLQFFSLKLSEQTHWTTHRAKVADYYYKSFAKTYRNLPDNTTVAFVGTPTAIRELSFALAAKYALLAWYPDKITNVIYQTQYSGNQGSALVYPVTVY